MIRNIISLLRIHGKHKIIEHSIKVAEMNVKIAEKFGLDKKKCEIAAYCHDVGGIISPENMLTHVKSLNQYVDPAEEKYPFLLHQRISATIMGSVFNIRDPEILSPINYHTTLKSNPSQYEMALFVADKLAWDQDGTPPFYDEVNNALEISLYHASYAYIKYVTDNNMILYPHKWFTEAKEWLEGKINE
jgi:putative HD superfamily hydrolase of NAD metabolism